MLLGCEDFFNIMFFDVVSSWVPYGGFRVLAVFVFSSCLGSHYLQLLLVENGAVLQNKGMTVSVDIVFKGVCGQMINL